MFEADVGSLETFSNVIAMFYLQLDVGDWHKFFCDRFGRPQHRR